MRCCPQGTARRHYSSPPGACSLSEREAIETKAAAASSSDDGAVTTLPPMELCFPPRGRLHTQCTHQASRLAREALVAPWPAGGSPSAPTQLDAHLMPDSHIQQQIRFRFRWRVWG